MGPAPPGAGRMRRIAGGPGAHAPGARVRALAVDVAAQRGHRVGVRRLPTGVRRAPADGGGRGPPGHPAGPGWGTGLPRAPSADGTESAHALGLSRSRVGRGGWSVACHRHVGGHGIRQRRQALPRAGLRGGPRSAAPGRHRRDRSGRPRPSRRARRRPRRDGRTLRRLEGPITVLRRADRSTDEDTRVRIDRIEGRAFLDGDAIGVRSCRPLPDATAWRSTARSSSPGPRPRSTSVSPETSTSACSRHGSPRFHPATARCRSRGASRARSMIRGSRMPPARPA